MGGLLYKDFVSIKGKQVSITMAGLVILFLIFRVIFSGNYINENFMAVTEAGKMVVTRLVNQTTSLFMMRKTRFVHTCWHCRLIRKNMWHQSIFL